MELELITLFYIVDTFCVTYEPIWRKSLIESGARKRNRLCRMSLSEILTIMVYFHSSGYRTFKWYYERQVLGSSYMHSCFPNAVSYTRFLELMTEHITPIGEFLLWLCSLSDRSGTYFIDSTSLVVCSNLRIFHNKVFSGVASRGKTSEGWFYGLKLHITINDKGELMSLQISPGNISDSNMNIVSQMSKGLTGKLFADRGYISKNLFSILFGQGLHLVTGVKNNMKNKLMPMYDKLMLRKRFIIETVNDHLKNSEQIEHTRHRSIANFISNLLAGLVAYQLLPKKPSIYVSKNFAIKG